MAGEPLKIDGDFGGEQDIKNVAFLVAIAVFDVQYVPPIVDNSLREKETGRQFGVMTGRAHRHANGAATDANLQRVLPRPDRPAVRRRYYHPNAEST